MAVVVLLLASSLAPAAEPAPQDVLPAGLEQAIDRGLFFLEKQQKIDGSFEAGGPPNAMAALAVLAFLSSGHAPDLGEHGLAVRNAVDYLVNVNTDNGYFGRDGGRMYSHCLVTIALSQVYGIESDEVQRRKLRLALDRALKVILAAQEVRKDRNNVGGWRYEPDSTDSDLSVTTWCILALHACRDAGLAVPRERLERARSYVLSCYRPQEGGFAYAWGAHATSSMTGAAIADLCLLDAADSDEAVFASRYLMDKPVREDTRHFYCALFYAALGGFEIQEDAWPAVWKNAYQQLLRKQRPDGSWPRGQNDPGNDDKAGRFYSTAMSLVTLSIPLHMLPLYEK